MYIPITHLNIEIHHIIFKCRIKPLRKKALIKMNNLHSNNNNRDLIDLTQFKEMPIKRVICKEVIQKI